MKTSKWINLLLLLATGALCVGASRIAAQDAAVTLINVKGTVNVTPKGEPKAKQATNNMKVMAGTTIQTAAGSSLIIRFADGSMVKVGPMSNMIVGKINSETNKSTRLDVDSGKVWARVEKLGANDSFEIKTPTAIAGVRGTYYSSEVDEDATSRFDVFDGEVAVSSVANPDEQVIVKANQTTSVEQGKAPSEPKALPKDTSGDDGFSETEFTAAAFDVIITIEPEKVVVGGKAVVTIQLLKDGQAFNQEIPLHLKANGSALFPNGKSETDVTTGSDGTASVEITGGAEESISIEASILMRVKKKK